MGWISTLRAEIHLRRDEKGKELRRRRKKGCDFPDAPVPPTLQEPKRSQSNALPRRRKGRKMAFLDVLPGLGSQ